MDSKAVVLAGVVHAEEAGAPPRTVLPPGGVESPGCERALTMLVTPAQLSPAGGRQKEAEVMVYPENEEPTVVSDV